MSDRPTYFTCDVCKVPSAKDLWGPGRVRCPCCGVIAPSAAEAALLPPHPKTVAEAEALRARRSRDHNQLFGLIMAAYFGRARGGIL